jgi:hypothetical protein
MRHSLALLSLDEGGTGSLSQIHSNISFRVVFLPFLVSIRQRMSMTGRDLHGIDS